MKTVWTAKNAENTKKGKACLVFFQAFIPLLLVFFALFAVK